MFLSFRVVFVPLILFTLFISLVWVYYDIDPSMSYPCTVFRKQNLRCGSLAMQIFEESDFRAAHEERYISIQRSGCWNFAVVRSLVLQFYVIASGKHRKPVVLDIGANVGLLSNISANLGGSVYSVEPLPTCVSIISCAKEHDPAQERNMKVVRAVVSEQKETCAVYSGRMDPYMATLQCKKSDDSLSVEDFDQETWEGHTLYSIADTKRVEDIVTKPLDIVIITSLDSSIDALESVFAAKDENGYAQKDYISMIILSVTPWRLQHRGQSFEDILNRLTENGLTPRTLQGEVPTGEYVAHLNTTRDSLWIIATRLSISKGENLTEEFNHAVEWLRLQSWLQTTTD